MQVSELELADNRVRVTGGRTHLTLVYFAGLYLGITKQPALSRAVSLEM